MRKFLSRVFKKAISKFLLPDIQFRYSQFGEDLIIHHYFSQKGVLTPSYLDIGGNEPRYISNTYWFYERGSKGVLVEPNPFLVKKNKRVRPNDTVIAAGVGIDSKKEADYYMFDNKANGLNTFSEKEAKHWAEVGMQGSGKFPIKQVIKVPLITVGEIIEKYFANRAPDFLSLDVEGLDLDILKSIPWNRFRPELICVESLSYDDSQKGYKNREIIEFLLGCGYELYADTRVNSIFVDTNKL